jgi:hypothetical protein
VLFPNGFKDKAPDAGRPDQWGWCNPSDGTPPFQIGTWLRQFEDSNRPYLSGSAQYPLPGKTIEQQQDAAAEVEKLAASGKVTRGSSERKGRGARE